eukprot:TRINITY_DN40015_c0_g1_i1.p1 TRINITY_DN40015_c0_g1~~TRINITY_DN40015_c0_g1_i1.p1  ORF type:complete len:322 (+),score=35.16 TRINITY_DN40015_c0_g1_i1:67-966(+)
MAYGSTDNLAEPQAADNSKESPDKTEKGEKGIDFEKRSINTVEVLISKIFPAGFGWQALGFLASLSLGLPATSIGFALMTGLGDFLGVLLGHLFFSLVKQTWCDATVSMDKELHVGLFLACAAFLSGTAWQPAVNGLGASGLGFGFNLVAIGTGLICGTMFMIGLRLGRTIYSKMELTCNTIPSYLSMVQGTNYVPAVEAPSSENLILDAQLALSIAGGAACFVGTDVTFGASNWLRAIVGVYEKTPLREGCVKAGLSTLLGFGAVQLVQNAFIPRDGCWTDASKPLDVRGLIRTATQQ